MLLIRFSTSKTRPREIKCLSNRCTIGRGSEDMVPLQGWNIGKAHAMLERRPEGSFIQRGENGRAAIKVNGKAINQDYGPLTDSDEILIGSYRITVQTDGASGGGVNEGVDNEQKSPLSDKSNPAKSMTDRVVPLKVKSENNRKTTANKAKKTEESVAAADDFVALRKMVHTALLREFDLRRTDVHTMSEEKLRETTSALLEEIIARMGKRIPAGTDTKRLLKAVLDEAIGLGPLEDLLAEEAVTEIMVNRFDEIFVERKGRLTQSEVVFTGDQAVVSAIERIAAPLGRRIDESSPLLDARLADGSRVNAVISPIALRGPSLTIRKFAKHKLSPGDLLKFGSASESMLEFMRIAVEQRKNVIVSGGTGSGKTTLLNILSNNIPDTERIVSIEDAAELKLYQPNLVSMEARPPNTEGKGEIVIRDLVKNALRMRPDRIVVGECRGGEALDMLQAMNTGHDGSLTTVHANSTRDALSRLEVMVLMSSMDLPVSAIREQVSSAVNVIIQQRRFACGSRKITSICEVTGIESGRIQLQELFAFRQQDYNGPEGRVRGYYETTGAIPEFFQELAEQGYPVDLSLFEPVKQGAGA